MKILNLVAIAALLPLAILASTSEDSYHHGHSSRVRNRIDNHRENHTDSHHNRRQERRANRKSRRHQDEDHGHRYARVGAKDSYNQHFGERVAQPVVTAGGTVADVTEDVITLRPGEAVKDAVEGTGRTARDVLAIPFPGIGGR